VVRGAWCVVRGGIGSTLDARRSTLDARRSTLDARRSTLETLDARRSARLDARRSTLDARRSARLDARRSTLGSARLGPARPGGIGERGARPMALGAR